MKKFKKGDILNVIISASELNFNEYGQIFPFSEDFEYRIDVSFYLNGEKESFIDISYTVAGDTAKNLCLEKELEMNIRIKMKELEIKKYSVLESKAAIADGYGRQIIKIH